MAYLRFVVHVESGRVVVACHDLRDLIEEAADAAVRGGLAECLVHGADTGGRGVVGGAGRAAQPRPAPAATPAQEGGR